MKKIFSKLMLVTLSLFFLTNCSTLKKDMNVSRTVPASSGVVAVKIIENDNTYIKLKVKHLAFPEKIRPNATTYLLWARPGEGTEAVSQNIGSLQVNDNMEGTVESITTLKVFNLFLTAEYSSQVSTPTGEELMWTSFREGDIKKSSWFW
jgi:hypothetical protein